MDIIALAQAIGWPLAVIIGIIVLAVLVKHGKIRSLSLSKDGGIAVGMESLETRATLQHYMDKRIIELDDELGTNAKAISTAMRKPILRAVAGSGLCAAALRALAGDLRGPLYHAVDQNDFKTRLATPAREAYLADKVAALRDEYQDLVEEASYDPCTRGPDAIKFPTWEEAEPAIRRAIESWAASIIQAVVDTCRAKVAVYQEFRPRFEAAGDSYFIKIIDEKIAKNVGYIEALGGKP